MSRKQRRVGLAASRHEPSTPPQPEPSPSQERPEDRLDGIELLESFDGFAGLRNKLREIAEKREDWAGIPMPLEGMRLVIEPKYPMAQELSLIGNPAPPEPDIYVRNRFYCDRWGCDVVIYEEAGGKIKHMLLPAFHHLGYDISTLGASDVWGIEQESRALHLLGTMVNHRQFKQYLLTGMFLERSERSGLTYMFRKLKPTVVVDARDQNSNSSCRILCTLCMHPIAYYEGSWAGAMVPTDDVISHLILMRGDEHMFWRRSNQHPPNRPEAGL